MENCICLLLKLTFFQHLELKNREWFWQRNWNNSAVSNAQFFLFILQKLCWMEDSPRLFNVQTKTHTHTGSISCVFLSSSPSDTHRTPYRYCQRKRLRGVLRKQHNTAGKDSFYILMCVLCKNHLCTFLWTKEHESMKALPSDRMWTSESDGKRLDHLFLYSACCETRGRHRAGIRLVGWAAPV